MMINKATTNESLTEIVLLFGATIIAIYISNKTTDFRDINILNKQFFATNQNTYNTNTLFFGIAYIMAFLERKSYYLACGLSFFRQNLIPLIRGFPIYSKT